MSQIEITVIDNYDSFTYNLVHFLGELGAKITVHRNDAMTSEEILDEHPVGIVISPGPCDPDKAGICLDLIEKANGEMPILGVCLGFQSIGQAYGGKVVRALKVMHGKTSTIHHWGEGVFKGIPDEFTATRYHSLIVERESLPEDLKITAETEDGVIMGIQHISAPVYGVQFHPESIASEYGHKLLENFLIIGAESRAA